MKNLDLFYKEKGMWRSHPPKKKKHPVFTTVVICSYLRKIARTLCIIHEHQTVTREREGETDRQRERERERGGGGDSEAKQR